MWTNEDKGEHFNRQLHNKHRSDSLLAAFCNLNREARDNLTSRYVEAVFQE
jgi:hypothetical protein